LPKWALWAGIGVIGLIIIGVVIGLGGNPVDLGKGGDGPLAMLATETATATVTPTSKLFEEDEILEESSTPYVSAVDSSNINDENVGFFEDFEDGMVQQIKGVYGDWEILSNELGDKVYDIDNSNGSAFPGIDLGELFWSDYKINLSLQFLTVDNKWAIIEFRRNGNADNKYILSFENDGISLHQTTNGIGWQLITWKDYKISSNTWYDLEIEISGTIITIIVDDDVLIQTEDSRFSKGSINIQVGPWTHAQFDDIQVILLD